MDKALDKTGTGRVHVAVLRKLHNDSAVFKVFNL